MSNKKQINLIVLNSLFIALTAISTIVLSFPIGSQGGYFNIGDSIIIIASVILGPISGMIIGGVGSCIADLIIAPQYAFYTLFIKALEGFLIGLFSKKKKFITIGIIIGLLSMVINYYFVGVIMYSSFVAPLVDTLFNFIQLCMSLILSLLVLMILKKRGILNAKN